MLENKRSAALINTAINRIEKSVATEKELIEIMIAGAEVISRPLLNLITKRNEEIQLTASGISKICEIILSNETDIYITAGIKLLFAKLQSAIATLYTNHECLQHYVRKQRFY